MNEDTILCKCRSFVSATLQHCELNQTETDAPGQVPAPNDHRDHDPALHLAPNIRARPCQRARGAREYRRRSDDSARVPSTRGRRPVQDRIPDEREECAGKYDRTTDAKAIGERACDDGGDHCAEVWRYCEELRVRGGKAEPGDDRGEEEGG